jgi:hypothetical protein
MVKLYTLYEPSVPPISCWLNLDPLHPPITILYFCQVICSRAIGITHSLGLWLDRLATMRYRHNAQDNPVPLTLAMYQ